MGPPGRASLDFRLLDWTTLLVGTAIEDHRPESPASLHKVTELYQGFEESDLFSLPAPSEPGSWGVLLSPRLPVHMEMPRRSAQPAESVSLCSRHPVTGGLEF